MMSQGALFTALLKGIKKDKPEAVWNALALGASVKWEGIAALSSAAYRGRAEIAQLLLSSPLTTEEERVDASEIAAREGLLLLKQAITSNNWDAALAEEKETRAFQKCIFSRKGKRWVTEEEGSATSASTSTPFSEVAAVAVVSQAPQGPS